ncbi:3'(2'),5'-bisphosphate nucleotidase [Ancylobacter novellus DSM 506]|uniref:3'(2'),5'-bisphosphate nucleotidase CysQ n=1 Tax=Ancylobacter novellus (strain ATCC 8093 / DSM 506 / JCM 20403 / CCM 1077 / IAM 12100 / NBRC 12443 / NCIMB 10456) TaxID=639283 RepID=D7A4M5_ANCN5|nr:3'(2'),5'-bisphosphate nucleotidase CysQ [Ancylobacter novellus]ADH89888.1 3'(2'),5'-bisphosphate nucleotidase [Ancylobacter novellus DSM 506]
MSLPSSSAADLSLLAALAQASLKAGEVILRIRAEGITVNAKSDQSPVTAADLAAEELLHAELARILPGVPVIAEEAVAQGKGEALGTGEAPADAFLLVDPLDGTKEFIGASGEFTVNIGLVIGGVPAFGIVLAPAVARLYAGMTTAAGGAAFAAGLEPDAGLWTPIRCRPTPERGLVAVASRSHPDAGTEAILAELDVAERISCGSALKFGLVAEGRADIYPRLGTVCEWDVAAGHALVRAAGGSVCRPDGSPLPYGRTEAAYRVHGFIARGAAA